MSGIWDRAVIEEVLWRGVGALRGVLAEPALADLALLIRVGEYLVAYEMVATQTYEFDAQLDRVLVGELMSLGKALDADPKYGRWLADCVIGE